MVDLVERLRQAKLIPDLRLYLIYQDGTGDSLEVLLDDARAAIEEYKAAKQPVGWQPIETAPRDGTEFIGWEPQTEYQKEKGYGGQGNYDLCTWRNGGFYSESLVKPTHWMPLPEPPTKEG